MEKVTITCPFTGLDFDTIRYADGRLVTSSKITGEEIQLTYNSSIKKYMLDAKYLKHTPLVTMGECAQELGVSKPRVSALVKKGKLQAIKPRTALYITKESMLDYKRKQRHRTSKGGNDYGARAD